MYQMLMSTPTFDPLLQLHPRLVRKCGESTSFYPHCTHILCLGYELDMRAQCKRCVCLFACLIYSPATTSSQREGDSCIAVCVFALERGVNKLLHYTQDARGFALATANICLEFETARCGGDCRCARRRHSLREMLISTTTTVTDFN
jgi:hypothetical protein